MCGASPSARLSPLEALSPWNYKQDGGSHASPKPHGTCYVVHRLEYQVEVPRVLVSSTEGNTTPRLLVHVTPRPSVRPRYTMSDVSRM